MQSRSLALIGLACTSLFWAGNALVARSMVESIPPVAMSFWRWTISLALLSPFIISAWRRYHNEFRSHFAKLFVLAALSISSFNSLLYLAAQATSAINITLVNTTTPVVTTIFAILLIRHRPSTTELIGIAVALAGAVWLICRGQLQLIAGMALNPGDLIMLIGVGTWSLYSVLLRRWAVPIPTFPLFCLLVLLGTPAILPFYLWEYRSEGGFGLSTEVFLALLYVGILPSIAAYVLWNHGIQVVGPSIAAAFSYLTPLLAASLAIPLLGERLETYHLIGAALTLGGLYIASRR